MQVKVGATIFALILFPLVRRFLISPIINKIKDSKKRYTWTKRASYFIYILLFIVIGSIWFEGFESIATYLGFVSAAIAFALKDPIANFAGWMFITTRAPFKVGDRIELGNNAGDVIDINLFNFSIMEMGNWVDADDMTGRIIHIPNGRVFTDTLANYGRGFKYIWNELPVLITFESDWKKAKLILEKFTFILFLRLCRRFKINYVSRPGTKLKLPKTKDGRKTSLLIFENSCACR